MLSRDSKPGLSIERPAYVSTSWSKQFEDFIFTDWVVLSTLDTPTQLGWVGTPNSKPKIWRVLLNQKGWQVWRPALYRLSHSTQLGSRGWGSFGQKCHVIWQPSVVTSDSVQLHNLQILHYKILLLVYNSTQYWHNVCLRRLGKFYHNTYTYS